MVSTPAVANKPQSRPVALIVRVITAEMGFALVIVSVRANSSSTQLNIKQKNAVTPTPALISGYKNGDKETRQAIAVDKGGFVNFPGNAGHEAFQYPYGQGHVEQTMGQGHGNMGIDEADG